MQKIQKFLKADANRRNNCLISKGYKLEQSQEILSKFNIIMMSLHFL